MVQQEMVSNSMWQLMLIVYATVYDMLPVKCKINLPSDHMEFYFFEHPEARAACIRSQKCAYKKLEESEKCWGYEDSCVSAMRYSSPLCNDNSKGWSKTKAEQIETFFKQADFGYIKERRKEITMLCEPRQKDDSSLECTKYLRFCKAHKIMFDFNALLSVPEPMRYREDVMKPGQVGGYCKLKKEKLKSEGQHKSPLQSWFAELEPFTELPSDPISDKTCEVIIDKPTYIMKLDASVNMYHHFCDFLNLYASLHLNGTFTSDVYILIWDTVPYRSNFAVTWQAFTKHPVMNIGEFKGKKVCFLDVVFPLLPRMIFGMYYNMPLIPGCCCSGLFQAFAEHIKDRLNIASFQPNGKVRVTLISRATKYRRITNEDQLVSSLEHAPGIEITKINFNQQLTFFEQLEISSNSDILIGIHGAGLTHMLFMPPWGVVFEIYNCDDENCYSDLARLIGIRYLTWRKNKKIIAEDEGHHPTLGAHAKFTNYKFDVGEFRSIVEEAVHYVRNNTLYLSVNRCKGYNCNVPPKLSDEL